MNKSKGNSGGIVAIFVIIILLIATLGSCSGGNSGGDGKSTCRNCGRKTSLVAGYGYCGTCYKGFKEWQNKNGY